MPPQYFQDICRQFHLMPNLKQLPPTFFIAPEMYTTGLGLPPILRLDIIFEAISLAFSLVITVIGLYAWRRIGSKTLLLLSLGFLTMSAAMLLRIVLISWAFSFMPEQGPRLRILPFSCTWSTRACLLRCPACRLHHLSLPLFSIPN
jgi:hypothetical protein